MEVDQVISTEEEVVETPSAEIDLSTSGLDDLRAAFAETPSEGTTDTESAPGTENTSTEEGPGTQTGALEASAVSEEDISRVFQDPRVVTMLQQAQGQSMAQARKLWENELQALREQEEALLLDDEEVGKRVREQQRMEPVLTRARAEGYARAQQDFVANGIGDLWQKVPELRELDRSEKAKYDPTLPTWKTMGEYLNAVVDVAAAKRSEKLATAKAKELAKAMTADELNKFRKNQPSPAGVPGHGREVGKIVDIDSMSGKDILRAAFGN
jgi:hypothetical protein